MPRTTIHSPQGQPTHRRMYYIPAVLAALFHSLLAAESAAEEGRKVVLTMLAVGGIFVAVIALGELAHWVAKQRRH